MTRRTILHQHYWSLGHTSWRMVLWHHNPHYLSQLYRNCFQLMIYASLKPKLPFCVPNNATPENVPSLRPRRRHGTSCRTWVLDARGDHLELTRTCVQRALIRTHIVDALNDVNFAWWHRRLVLSRWLLETHPGLPWLGQSAPTSQIAGQVLGEPGELVMRIWRAGEDRRMYSRAALRHVSDIEP